MGSLFFILISISIVLFFPIYLDFHLYFDMNRRKLTFALYGYKFIKIIGGYIATYTGGLAAHITEKKAIIIPYANLNNERKRFSFFQFLRLKNLTLSIETGAEYLLPAIFAHIITRIYVFLKSKNKDILTNNLLLQSEDSLKISIHSKLFFNLFIAILYSLQFIQEKILFIWQKNIKKSTI